MGDAAAAGAWALTVILEASTVTDAGDDRFSRLSEMITEAAEHLDAARDHLQDIHDAAADLTSVLFPTATEDSGHNPVERL